MKQLLCTSCGYQGKPKLITKGSIGIEIILWLFFLLPGLIYSVWRHTTRYKGCPQCGADSLIPQNSPVAQKFMADINNKASEPAKQIVKAVESTPKEPPPKKWTNEQLDDDDQPNVYVID